MSDKNAAPFQDFSGQDTGYPSSSPAAEVANNHDGGTAGVNSQFVPTIDDPSKNAKSTVYASDDIRLHASRSEVGGKYTGSYPP